MFGGKAFWLLNFMIHQKLIWKLFLSSLCCLPFCLRMSWRGFPALLFCAEQARFLIHDWTSCSALGLSLCTSIIFEDHRRHKSVCAEVEREYEIACAINKSRQSWFPFLTLKVETSRILLHYLCSWDMPHHVYIVSIYMVFNSLYSLFWYYFICSLIPILYTFLFVVELIVISLSHYIVGSSCGSNVISTQISAAGRVCGM